MPIEHAARFLRTVRHLRCSQMVWRGRYLLERRLGRRAAPEPNGIPKHVALPARAGEFPVVPLLHTACSAAEDLLALLLQGRIEILGQQQPFDPARPDWRLGPCTRDRLWAVTLHYHEWAYRLAQLAARGETRAEDLLVRLLDDWLASCSLESPGARELAWNAFAIASRLGWWARMWQAGQVSVFAPRSQFAARLLESFHRQADFLHEHLEWDLRGNHLLRDAVGLAWAGRFLQGPAAQSWLGTATRLADQQASEQVLADGGHFERSPMYHVQAMEDILTLSLLLDDHQVADRLRNVWRRMADYLCWVRHPDGQIALLNDAALGGACPAETMLEQGRRLGLLDECPAPVGGRLLAHTGIVAWHGQPWSVIFDVGPLGPDYQPGHGHADNLTLEASFAGRRVLVDPGTYSYDDDARRRRLRGTGSHNTVCIDGADSSETWGIFRVGRRARPIDVEAEFTDRTMSARAAHDGYDFLPSSPRHQRAVQITGDGRLLIEDRVQGSGRHQVSGGLLIEPAWSVQASESGWLISSTGRTLRVAVQGSVELRLAAEPAEYCPDFGVVIPTTRLVWRYEGPLPVDVRVAIQQP